MVEASELSDVISLLKLSSYGEELGKLNSPRMDEVEGILRESLLANYRKICSSLYGFGKIFIQRAAKKFEVQALKGAFQLETSTIPSFKTPPRA